MLTASQSPRSIALRMTEAVWKPPVQMTGTVDRLLDDARIGQGQPLDLIRRHAGVEPLPAEQTRRSALPRNSRQLRKRVAAARGELLVGVRQHVDVQVAAGRIPRMREGAAGRDMDRVDAGLDQPVADLRPIPRRVLPAAPRPGEQRVVVVGRADLHLQVEVAADPRADRPDDVEHEAGAVLERAAVFVRRDR